MNILHIEQVCGNPVLRPRLFVEIETRSGKWLEFGCPVSTIAAAQALQHEAEMLGYSARIVEI